MVHFVAAAAALALAAFPFSGAQTYSACDPTKTANCPTKPGLQTDYTADFRQGASAATNFSATSGSVAYGNQGQEYTITKLGDGPTLATDFYILFGYVEVTMQAAPGQGIVSSFVMESDDLDEIDWEWIGSDTGRAQSNYFGKGNTTTYDRGMFHDVSAPTSAFHTYAVNWTQETTTWFIDGKVVRTLNFADAVGGKNYPQTPMNIRLGSWVAGDPKNSPGTIQWAGGLTDFSKGPFNMYVQSVKIINYSPAESYKYGDQSGNWQSIQLLGTAASAGLSNDVTNSTTGPGEVPFSSSSATGGLGPQTTFLISPGGMGPPSGVIGRQTTTCTDRSHHTGSSGGYGSGSGSGQGQGVSADSVDSESTFTISPGAIQTPAAGISNSTGPSGGGIVAVGPGLNNTQSTVTIDVGSSGVAAVATSNPTATSFSIGASSTAAKAAPAQETGNTGPRNNGQSLVALAGVMVLAVLAV